MRLWIARPAVWAAGLAACVVSAGCGHSASPRATSPAPSAQSATGIASVPAKPAPSAGLAGNGSLSQAGTICQGFVDHLNRTLAPGVGALSPALAPSLVSELEGLSRRIQFLRAPTRERATAARWAADLDRAATIANGLAGMGTASSAERQRYAVALDTERVALQRANADAVRLGLRRCLITVRGAAGPRTR
jgi:hypothetical protein